MQFEKTLLLKRENLIPEKRHKEIDIIDYDDFVVGRKPSQFMVAEIILFIDDNGQTKILRNRFGDEGITK